MSPWRGPRPGRLDPAVVALLVAAAAGCASNIAAAQTVPERQQPQPSGDVISQLDDLKLELAGLFGVITYAGVRDWKWGTAYFRFNSEGWFGMDTGSGGQDKLGHAFSSYLMSEFLYLRLRTYYGDDAPVTVFPPIFSWSLMLYVEVFDGYSVDHGFSYEDLVMDTAGVTLSFLRQTFPSFGRLVDYRMEYFPSDEQDGFHPMIDYSGQKFLFAFRPSGIEPVRSTPLRFFELYLGYYSRGFLSDAPDAIERTRLYVGAGIDLEQVFAATLGSAEKEPGGWKDYASTTLRSFQAPYPYPKISLHERQGP